MVEMVLLNHLSNNKIQDNDEEKDQVETVYEN